jgi:hypothetical protein
VVTALRVLASNELVWSEEVTKVGFGVFPTPALLDNGILPGNQKQSHCICYNATDWYGFLFTQKSQVHRALQSGRSAQLTGNKVSLLRVSLLSPLSNP